jgi:hypothetical protein
VSMTSFDVAATRCRECLFGANRIVSGARAAQLLDQCRKNDTHFVCHKFSQEGRDVCCRGFFETQPPTQLMRVAGRLGVIRDVEVPW